MKLIEMSINNFGSYKDNTIFRFEDDITVYQGPNGAGKSTMIEAIFYAFFGELAKEGIKDYDYVPLYQQGAIKLTFEHKTEKFVIERSLKPSISKTGKITPNRKRKLTNLTKRKILTTEAVIGPFINQMLGEKTTVKNSIYSPQGQLHSLISLKGEVLKKELSKIFGIEQYKSLALIWERLNKKANDEKSGLEDQIETLSETCSRIPEIISQKTSLEIEDKTLETKLSDLEKQAKKLEGIQSKKIEIETEIKNLKKNIEENTPTYNEKNEELSKIEDLLPEEKINNPEKAIVGLNTEFSKLSDRIDILDPFIKETKVKVEELVIENAKLDERSSQLQKSIDNLIEKSSEKESPHGFEKEEADELINKNRDLVNTKIMNLEKNEGIIHDLIVKAAEISTLKEKSEETSIKSFIQNLELVINPEFQFENITTTNEADFAKWLNVLEKEIASLVTKEKNLNDVLIEYRTSLNSLYDDLKEKREILRKLKSGEIDTCTECGTELTPELRRSNQDKTTKAIEKIENNIKNIKDKQKLARNELEDQKFKDKIDVIETNNLKNKVAERITDVFTSFQNFKVNVSTLSQLDKELEEIYNNLSQEWKNKLRESNIEDVKIGLEKIKQYFISFRDDLKHIEENLTSKAKKEEEIKNKEAEINDLYIKYELKARIPFDKLKAELESKNQEKSDIERAIQELRSYRNLKEEVGDLKKKLEKYESNKKSMEEVLVKSPYNTLEKDKEKNKNEKQSTNDRRLEIARELSNLIIDLEASEKACEDKKFKEDRISQLTSFAALANSIAKVFREVRPKLLNFKTKRIVERTNRIVLNMPSQADTLRLEVEEDGDEYNLVVFRNGEKGKFGTVSGGELTGLGFALRVAIAQELSNVGILILDEPTYGLDKSRRSKLAEILVAQKHIKQLLVVTHDEIFNGKTSNITQIRQNNGASRNMADELGLQEDDLEWSTKGL
ncbi:MAG: AAA family ATPase [Candidatus Hodarchaeales archaeon]